MEEARIPRNRLSDVALIVGLAAVYALTARLGLAFDAVAGCATLVWPPTGISIAALILLGNRVWPGVFIGAFAANLLSGAPVLVALGIAIGNTLEATAGAYVLRHTPKFSLTLETTTSAVGILLASIGPTLISATIGVLSLYFGGVIAATQVRVAWPAWWIGDMVGVLLVTPLILVWSRQPRARFQHHWSELLALTVALAIITTMTFFRDHVPSLTTPFHQTDVLLGVLIWAALRFGQRGAVTAAFFICAMAVAATALRFGPFWSDGLSNSLLSLQTFMGIIAATCLLLGATISELRHALEETGRAHEEAARANLAKSEFLAIMSHELRTPLNAIAGYADLLTADVYGSLNNRQADAVARIRRNEKNLLAVIDEVLGFVSVEKGQVSVQGEDIPVAIAFDEVEPLIRPDVQRKHVVVKRDLEGPRLTVRADRKSLQRILMSLLSNASKYTADGGLITLGAAADGTTVRIWVQDNGIGISPEELKNVFKPFFQAERATTRRYAGVGLGLTIARDLARLMEGEITLASQPGRGTTATIVLPAAPESLGEVHPREERLKTRVAV